VLASSRDRALESLVASLGLSERVTITGFLDPERELPLAYRAADVLTCASECEGQGIAFLEGMASGLPVVAVDRYAVREIVIDGETGLLVAPGDEVAFAAALDRLIGDRELRRRFGEEGRRRAAPHDLEPSVDDIERLLQRLARERP
jgi:glycosyltransferase involved in cell wall biosynthesis